MLTTFSVRNLKMVYFPLILLLIVGVTSGSYIGQGNSEPVDIINGNSVPITKYNFMASLTIYGKLFGSGVILNKNWILTTAFNVAWMDPSNLQFRVGSNSWQKGGTILNVKNVTIHENYKDDSWDYNVAVVKVDKPMKFGKKIGSANLSSVPLTKGQPMVCGWGEKVPLGDPSNVLLAAKTTVNDWNTCQQYYPTELTQRMMCTYDTTDGPCWNDFGGPLSMKSVVYGLYAGAYNCTPAGSSPQLYTDISSLYDWIENAIKE